MSTSVPQVKITDESSNSEENKDIASEVAKISPTEETDSKDDQNSSESTNGVGDSQPSPAITKSIFAPSKLGGFSSLESKGSTSILAPSRLLVGAQTTKAGDNSSESSPFKFLSKPVGLGSSNPFAKLKYSGEEEGGSGSNIFSVSSSDNKSSDKEGDTDGKSGASSHNLFLPPKSGQSSFMVGSTDSKVGNLFSGKSSNGTSSANSFVFGRNLHSKVSGAEEGSNCDTAELPSTENIFTAAASNVAKSESNSSEVKSLEASSRELEEKESREKRKFDEIEVVTGEETELNVIQMNCKLYGWVQGTWKERGRGILRLNDWGESGQDFQSRLVVRTQGTLTIMLNTNIWGDMSVEKASKKSIRFTAADSDGQPKLYLAMGQPRDIDVLHASLETRVGLAKSREDQKTEDKPVKKTKTEEAAE